MSLQQQEKEFKMRTNYSTAQPQIFLLVRTQVCLGPTKMFYHRASKFYFNHYHQ